ncbi:hypothetical protein DL95DRAFT_454146 [Leptodontidium sp. 2 PMI_412]|nr:hypothetical protein DL95DRAFT_454146 [Leptodontidium sp. 2 PMI_412]
MEPPEIPPQTRRYRKEEWEVHRGLIVGLYPMQGMKLRTIKEILEQDHAFIVNERQLKKKIDDWKIGKNVQSSEMAFIVHKQHQRTLARKPTVFRARGQPVDPEKISRWQKGPGKSIEMNGSPVPSTPSDISYSPPSAKSPSPRVMDTAADPNQTASNSMTNWSSNTSQQHQPLFGNVDGDVPICNANEASLDALMAHEYSPFEGRSPPPFTPRPSPSPSISSAQLRNVSGFTIESIFPAQSLSPAETSSPGPRDLIPLTQESMRSPLPADWSLQGNNIHQAPSTSSSPSKTRYREKEELDLRQRLENFELQHGPSHPASLDTMSRLANVLQDQGRLRSAEVYFRRVAESWLANL